MKPNKIESESVNGAELNLEALYQIAPSCFTEIKDAKTGELRHVINFTTLRQLLGDDAVEDADEMYQFIWPGKQDARREAARPINKTLRPVVEDSVDWDNTQNLYIEGDNLEVLKLLQKSYLGKVKMIYIDPPYNTGNDFVYNDNFTVSKDDYNLFSGDVDELGNRYRKNTDTNGRFHSDWCSMIYPRLMVARSLLTDDGVIFISIDDNEQRNLKNICDEVFGEGNFVAQINWKARGGRQDSKYYAAVHEYILCYAKNISKFVAGEDTKAGETYPKYDMEKKRYYKTQLLRKWGSNSRREDRPNLFYPIIAPDGTEVYPMLGKSTKDSNNFGCWRHGINTMKKNIDEGYVEFVKQSDGSWIPYEKIYQPLDGEQGKKKYTTWVEETNDGSNVIKELFEKTVFDYPKSPSIIIRLLKMANAMNQDIILDFFSGSASTAHAVMQLNAEDEGNRKFILVQLPEETSEDSEAHKAGYNTIPEIAKERIRRAGKKIKAESPLTTQNLDTGFRVFRLADSNFEEEKKAPKDYSQDKLDASLNNVKADRTDLDLLFGAMLNWGVQLSLPMTTEEIEGKKIYFINNGDLAACFDDDITENILKSIAAKEPIRILFRDRCFTRDDAKINVFETLKQLLNWSEEEAMKNIRVI